MAAVGRLTDPCSLVQLAHSYGAVDGAETNESPGAQPRPF